MVTPAGGRSLVIRAWGSFRVGSVDAAYHVDDAQMKGGTRVITSKGMVGVLMRLHYSVQDADKVCWGVYEEAVDARVHAASRLMDVVEVAVVRIGLREVEMLSSRVYPFCDYAYLCVSWRTKAGGILHDGRMVRRGSSDILPVLREMGVSRETILTLSIT